MRGSEPRRRLLAGASATLLLASSLVIFSGLPAVARPATGLTRYVNPFIGTNPAPGSHYGFGFDTGDVFPGAAFPEGML